jgi:hypothetical protein
MNKHVFIGFIMLMLYYADLRAQDTTRKIVSFDQLKQYEDQLINPNNGFVFDLFKKTKCELIVTPDNAKQGDNISIAMSASGPIDSVVYSFGPLTGKVSALPATVNLNTCKISGVYYTELDLSAKFYVLGFYKKITEHLYLTIGVNSREDIDKDYVLYVGYINDNGRKNDILAGMANAFQDEFDAYKQTQYLYAQPRFFTRDAISFVNSADMAIFLGEGDERCLLAGPDEDNDWVGSLEMEYGNFTPCGQEGDCEILVSGSCRLLAFDSDGSLPISYWMHGESTKLEKRAFSGLHMICGFRTDHKISSWWWGRRKNSSEDFFKSFAKRLDDGSSVKDAWLDAAGDNLDFDDGYNRTAVFYLWVYEDHNVYTDWDDYIYGNSIYNDGLFAEYWE